MCIRDSDGVIFLGNKVFNLLYLLFIFLIAILDIYFINLIRELFFKLIRNIGQPFVIFGEQATSAPQGFFRR